MVCWFFLILLTLALPVFSGPEPYSYNPDKNICEPVFTNHKNKRPQKVQDILASGDFEEISNSLTSCKDQPTCLSKERLTLLKDKQFIPSGINTLENLNNKIKVCGATDPFVGERQFIQNTQSLFEYTKTYPVETEMSLEVIKKTKQIVDNLLKNSREANRIILQCLESESGQKKISDFCQSVKNKIDQAQLPTQLKLMRQTMALKHLVEKMKFKNLADLQMALKFYDKDPQKKLLAENLIHSKPLASMVGLDEFWEGTPDHLEKLNEVELKELYELSDQILDDDKSIQDVEAFKDVVNSGYYSLISDSPVLIHFDKAMVDKSSMAKAFSAYNKKMNAQGDLKIRDVDYLNFTSIVNEVLSDYPADKRGDMCVLSINMLQSRKSMKSSVQNLAAFAWTVETAGGMLLVKGLGKKALALVTSAHYSTTALMTMKMTEAYSQLQKNQRTCLISGTGAGGVCQVAVMDSSANDVLVGAAVTTFVGAASKAQRFFQRK